MPVNTLQLGPEMNGLAGNLSLADFLLASSTNDVAAPDFKTIAAGLFAGTSTTTTGQTNTQAPQIPVKAIGLSTPRERETKENHSHPSETPSPFLTIIPVHLLNFVPSQYHLASHPQFSGFPAQDDTQIDTNTPTVNDAAVASLPLSNQFLPTEPQTQSITNNFPRTKNGSDSTINAKPENVGFILPPTVPKSYELPHVSGTNKELQKTNEVEDGDLILPANQTRLLPKDVVLAPQPKILIVEEKIAENARGGQVTSQIAEASGTKTNTTPKVTPSMAPKLHASEINTEPAKPATPKVAVNPTNEESVQHRADHPATNMRQTPATSSDLWPVQTTKNEVADQVQQPDSLVPRQANSNQDAGPAQQLVSIPQSVGHVMKSVVAEATVLDIATASPRTTPCQTNSTPIRAAHADAVAQSAATQSDPAPAQSDTRVLKNDVSPLPNACMTTPAVRTTISKGRTETAPKSKIQRANPDTQTTVGNVNEPHERSVHSVSEPQNTANTGSDKNHNADAALATLTPHTKLVPTKNTAGVSDFAPIASSTQVPDIDDTTPTAHASINTAKLVQGLSQSELRVGLQTRDFGNIDIRTSVSHHEFSAQISVEHSDVARTLSTELPALYERLNDQQVQVNSIQIQSQSFSASSGMDQHSQQPTSHSQSRGTFRSQTEPALPAIHEVLSPTERLDIRI